MSSGVAWVLYDPEAPGGMSGSTSGWLYLLEQPAYRAGTACFAALRGTFVPCSSSSVHVAFGISRRTSHPFWGGRRIVS